MGARPGGSCPGSCEPAASISPAPPRRQHPLGEGERKKTSTISRALPAGGVTGLIHGMTTRELSGVYSGRFGSISLPARPRPGVLTREKCLYGISNGFHRRPAPCTRSRFAGLQAKSSTRGSLLWFAVGGGGAGGSKRAPCPCLRVWQRAGGEEPSFELKARGEHSDTCPAGHREPRATTTMTHQHPSAKSDGLRQRHPPSDDQRDGPCHLPWGTQLRSTSAVPKPSFNEPGS